VGASLRYNRRVPRVQKALVVRGAPERLAAIDIGSNSIHMIVVERRPGGGYRVLDRERDMVRLGRSGLGRGRLSERAIERGLVALSRMTTLARLKGATRLVAVATSATREAENGDDFLARVRAHTGLAVRLLDGAEEGELIYRAVREAVDLGRRSALILDVGGGSTEWITTRAGRLGKVRSLALGSLRGAGELDGDPPSRRSLAALRRKIRRRLGAIEAPRSLDRAFATSGTAVCVADLIDHFGGRDWKARGGVLREIRRRDLAALVARLVEMKQRDLARLPPVGKPRAESIVAGAVLLEELLRRSSLDRLAVSDRALREGLVLQTLAEPTADSAPAGVRGRQVRQLAERAPSVLLHAEHTARLALRLFDLTLSLHRLGPREREWLENAALLHDVGYAVDYERHHKHGYYLITNAALDAFDPREIEVIAHVVRYHRGAAPSPRHAGFAALRGWQRRTVESLAALLRLAEALDRSHARRVEEIYCAIRKKRIRIEVVSPWDVTLELDTARTRGNLFEQAFGRTVEVRQGLRAAKRR
jgi:exopolyphosphatase/guanosine-5'-triphosphate,3'-diphosphate pyrophosphatase